MLYFNLYLFLGIVRFTYANRHNYARIKDAQDKMGASTLTLLMAVTIKILLWPFYLFSRK